MVCNADLSELLFGWVGWQIALPVTVAVLALFALAHFVTFYQRDTSPCWNRREGYEGKRPKTWLHITDAGRTALAAEMAALRALLDRHDSR